MLWKQKDQERGRRLLKAKEEEEVAETNTKIFYFFYFSKDHLVFLSSEALRLHILVTLGSLKLIH